MSFGPINSSLQGIQRGYQSLNQASQDIAAYTVNAGNGDSDARDLTSAAVELKRAEIQVKSSAESLRTADETLGSLLDVVA